MTELGLSGFEMIERLGGGGMATVWKARQVSLDRLVAVKILPPTRGTPEGVRRFQTEAQTAAKLKHPGIVQVYDACVENGIYFFVMEFVAGYTVGDWVRRKKVIPEHDALVVADCVADALQYAWDKERIIHCDVKPDNIMVDSDGTVKVADLGLARTISAMAADEVDEEVMGTPAYMSPEQAMGMSDLDPRTDIYSLGAVLYHLLTGRVMFEGESEDRMMELQAESEPEAARKLNPQISKGADLLLKGMLAKEKGSRHADWPAVRKDIARVEKGQLPRGTRALLRIASDPAKQERILSLLDEGRRGQGRRDGAPLWARVILGAAVLVLIIVVLLLCIGDGRLWRM